MEVTTPLNAQMTFTKTGVFDRNASNSKVVYCTVMCKYGINLHTKDKHTTTRQTRQLEVKDQTLIKTTELLCVNMATRYTKFNPKIIQTRTLNA